MKDLNKKITEQKLVIVDSSGHSRPLVGELEENRFGKSTEDLLPSYLNMGWQVVSMESFKDTGSILVLLHREQNI